MPLWTSAPRCGGRTTHSIATGVVLVTSNAREFERVLNLVLDDCAKLGVFPDS